MILIFFALTCVNLFWSFGSFFNFDMFLIPNIYRQISEGNLEWFYYTLTPARYLFPDIPLYALCRMVIPDAIGAYLLNIYVNFALFVGAVFLLARRFFPAAKAASILTVIAATCAIATIPGFTDRGVVRGLFYPSCHAEGLIWGLYTFFFGLRLVEKFSARRFCILAIFAFGLGFSDPLALAVSGFATVIVLALSPILPRWKRFAGALGILASMLAGSFLADRLIPLSPFQYMHQVAPSLERFKETFLIFLKDFRLPFVALASVAGILGVFWAYRNLKSEPHKLWGILAVALLPVAAALGNARYISTDCWHYFPFTFFLAVASVISILAPRRGVLAGLCLLTIFSTLWSYARVPATNWESVTYTPLAKRLDELKEPLGLQAGFAEVSSAMPANFTSKQGITVTPLNRFSELYLMNNSMADFGFGFTTEKPLTYNFVVADREIDTMRILETFGEPARVENITYENHPAVLLIYEKNLAPIMEKTPIVWELIQARVKHNPYFLKPEQKELLMKFLNEKATQSR